MNDSEMFTNSEDVISYKGANFYRACDAYVRNLPSGGTSHCVKRVGHSSEHEDFDGFRFAAGPEHLANTEENGKVAGMSVTDGSPSTTITMSTTCSAPNAIAFVLEDYAFLAKSFITKGFTVSVDKY